MNKIVLIGMLIGGIGLVNAQTGCMDSLANNFNTLAVQNDGSCTYNATHVDPILKGAFANVITESSGLVYTDGLLWTHNDSGNSADIYNVDTTHGNTLQTVHIDNYPNTDWEDITADATYIYVGDCGNNDGDRTDLKILRIKKSDIGTGADVHVNAEAIAFSYTDQTSFIANSKNNFDCESVVAIGDSLYLFTKDRGDFQTRVYRLPKTPGTYTISPYTSFNVNGTVTGVDYNPATQEIALIGYQSGKSNSFIWMLSDFEGNLFFSGNKRRLEIGNGKAWQTEGITYDNHNRLFISCETNDGISASLYYYDKSVYMPVWVTDATYHNTVTYFPNPSNDQIQINNDAIILKIEVLNTLGRKVFEVLNNDVTYTLVLNKFKYTPDVYVIRLSTASTTKLLKVVLSEQ